MCYLCGVHLSVDPIVRVLTQESMSIGHFSYFRTSVLLITVFDWPHRYINSASFVNASLVIVHFFYCLFICFCYAASTHHMMLLIITWFIRIIRQVDTSFMYFIVSLNEGKRFSSIIQSPMGCSRAPVTSWLSLNPLGCSYMYYGLLWPLVEMIH